MSSYKFLSVCYTAKSQQKHLPPGWGLSWKSSKPDNAFTLISDFWLPALWEVGVAKPPSTWYYFLVTGIPINNFLSSSSFVSYSFTVFTSSPSFFPFQSLLLPQLPLNFAVSFFLTIIVAYIYVYVYELYINASWYAHLVLLSCKFIGLLLFGIRQLNKGLSLGEDCFALFQPSLFAFSSLFRSGALWDFPRLYCNLSWCCYY